MCNNVADSLSHLMHTRRRWAVFFLFSAMQVGLAGWTFAGPPIVGKWAAGVFTMIDQFKGGSGASPHT